MRQITSRDEYFFDLALHIASLSTCRFKHGAVIMRSGNIISVGVNKYSHVKGITRRYPHNCITIHAEIAAIKHANGNNLRGTVLYSARVHRGDSHVLISNPCQTCRAILDDWGIHTIVYFNGHMLIKERI